MSPASFPFALIQKTHNVVSRNEFMIYDPDSTEPPVFAGPVKEKGGKIIGMLLVDRIDLLKFNKINYRKFS